MVTRTDASRTALGSGALKSAHISLRSAYNTSSSTRIRLPVTAGACATTCSAFTRLNVTVRLPLSPIWMRLHVPQGHPAFMPYGKDIPEHVPTRLVGEQYRKLADHFQLPVLGNTTVTRARYSNSKWTVELTSPKGGRKIESTWLLLCTGAGSQQPWMPTIPGQVCLCPDWPLSWLILAQNGFKGQVVHSSAYMNGEAWAGKKAIVVGTANSGHDMAQDLYLSGAASVTLVQREKTFVIAREHLGKLLGSAELFCSTAPPVA